MLVHPTRKILALGLTHYVDSSQFSITHVKLPQKSCTKSFLDLSQPVLRSVKEFFLHPYVFETQLGEISLLVEKENSCLRMLTHF